ncbi:hypothetical protein O3M35_003449 [Rhynocoris fuscipes]|uniref:Uncharacterized protein n=1 Tax=Rhynocoris fuscipes TaxID=488301 RepID=A0AAW1CMZ4_9HEMI
MYKFIILLSSVILFINASDNDRNTGPFNSPRAVGPRNLHTNYTNVLKISKAKHFIDSISGPSSSDIEQNFTGSSDLSGLLDLYNPHRLALKWNVTQESTLNNTCYHHMTIFLEQLMQGQLWALQSKSIFFIYFFIVINLSYISFSEI